jgi:hypothetical protein
MLVLIINYFITLYSLINNFENNISKHLKLPIYTLILLYPTHFSDHNPLPQSTNAYQGN